MAKLDQVGAKLGQVGQKGRQRDTTHGGGKLDRMDRMDRMDRIFHLSNTAAPLRGRRIEDSRGAGHRRPQHFWKFSAYEARHSWHMIWCGSYCLVV